MFWIYLAMMIFLTVIAIVTGTSFIIVGAVCAGFVVGATGEARFGQKESS